MKLFMLITFTVPPVSRDAMTVGGSGRIALAVGRSHLGEFRPYFARQSGSTIPMYGVSLMATTSIPWFSRSLQYCASPAPSALKAAGPSRWWPTLPSSGIPDVITTFGLIVVTRSFSAA
jgi:hypothetical protein